MSAVLTTLPCQFQSSIVQSYELICAPMCRKPLNRRFIVTEGIFAATGELAPLKAIHDLKTRFKYRLIVDESFALGVLGQHGRGACEHFGLQPGEVEIVCASLGNAARLCERACVRARVSFFSV